MVVEIILDKKVNLKDYTLIEGFPGIGLVGTIAAGYIIEKRKMEPIGHIYSDKFPPMTSIHQGKAYFPARIYKDSTHKICVLLAEFLIPNNVVYEVSNEIMKFAKQNKIKQIISLAGMTSAVQTDDISKKIFGIASDDKMLKFLKSKKVNIINEGVTTGVSGVTLAQCSVLNFPAASLLAESKAGEPDPRSSIELIKRLEDIVGLKVDTVDLLKEAEKIEKNMGQMMSRVKKMRRGEVSRPDELPMYQ